MSNNEPNTPGFEVDAGQDPNEHTGAGNYGDDPAMKISPEKKLPFDAFPKTPDPKPFKLNGG